MAKKSKLSVEQQVQILINMRFPGRKPEKSQIKAIRREVIRRNSKGNVSDVTKGMSIRELDSRRGDYASGQGLPDSAPNLTPGRSKNKEWARTQEYLDKLEKQSQERIARNNPTSTKD